MSINDGSRRASPTPTTGAPTTGATGSTSPLTRLKTEAKQTVGTAAEAKAGISAAAESRRGGPATTVEDATTKAAALRRSIERDVAALRLRVPETEEITSRARTAGAAVGGVVIGLAGLASVAKRRSARRGHEEQVREQAAAIAQELLRIEHGDDDEGRGLLAWLLPVAAAAVIAGLTWQRSRSTPEPDDVFGPAHPEPLRPVDVASVPPAPQLP